MKFVYNGIAVNFLKEEENIQQQTDEAIKHNESVMRKKNEYEYVFNFSHNRGNIVFWLDLPKESKILEVGAGSGGLTRCLTTRFSNVTVMEQNTNLVLQNITKKHENSFAAYCGNYEDILPLLDENYDCVIMNGIDLSFDKQQLLLAGLYHKICNRGILLYGVNNKYAPVSWFSEREALCNMTTREKGLQALTDAGFSCVDEYFPVPDSVLTMEIYEKEYMEQHGVDAGMYQLYHNEFELEHIKKLLAEGQKDGVLPDQMTTFLYIARKGEKNV